MTFDATPWVNFKLITKSDTVDILSGPPDAIYVGGAGTITLLPINGTAWDTITATAGMLIPTGRQIKRVMSTGTAATVFAGVYYSGTTQPL